MATIDTQGRFEAERNSASDSQRCGIALNARTPASWPRLATHGELYMPVNLGGILQVSMSTDSAMATQDEGFSRR